MTALQGSTILRAYDSHGLEDLLAVMRRNRARLSRDPDSRAFREELQRELSKSLDRLGDLRGTLDADETEAERQVYELYELPNSHRAMVDAEFDRH